MLLTALSNYFLLFLHLLLRHVLIVATNRAKRCNNCRKSIKIMVLAGMNHSAKTILRELTLSLWSPLISLPFAAPLASLPPPFVRLRGSSVCSRYSCRWLCWVCTYFGVLLIYRCICVGKNEVGWGCFVDRWARTVFGEYPLVIRLILLCEGLAVVFCY